MTPRHAKESDLFAETPIVTRNETSLKITLPKQADREPVSDTKSGAGSLLAGAGNASFEFPNDTGEPIVEILEGAAESRGDQCTGWEILDDHRHYYHRSNLRPLLGSLAIAGSLAHTNADQAISDWYQDDVRSGFSNEISQVAKHFGEQWEVVPIYVGASLLGRAPNAPPRVRMWGDRSLRSMIVGVPPLLLTQKILGSSRPRDIPPTSKWHLWADDNGASGHAFVGAVPFLVAAQLSDDPVARRCFFLASTLTAWSRINDNDHYTSQAIVGWYLAYLATRSVEQTDLANGPELVPLVNENGMGLGLTFGY